MAALSNSKVDAIGQRLRSGARLSHDEEGLFEAFLSSRDDALAEVVEKLRTIVVDGKPLSPSARLKTRGTTVEKLQREHVRLSQIQDVAGVRLVIDGGLAAQNDVRDHVLEACPGGRISDRREAPSHGYRAVHVIVTRQGAPVEVQIRTRRQHMWAEMFERLADRLGRQIRYGEPPTPADGDALAAVEAMMALSACIAELESVTFDGDERRRRIDQLTHTRAAPTVNGIPEEARNEYGFRLEEALAEQAELELRVDELSTGADAILGRLRELIG